MALVATVAFTDYSHSVSTALDLIAAPQLLPQHGLIVIKPNLTNTSAPPVTTDVRLAEALLLYCREHSAAQIIIAEGSGGCDTAQSYHANGYDDLAREHDVQLVDLNTAELVCLRRNDTLTRKKFYLAKLLLDAFVISAPVLKDHSMTTMTAALKNMFGIAPACHYKMVWNKAKLHWPSTHKSVVDVCLYKKPELSVIDASVAMIGQHLNGRPKKLGRILAGADPVATDATAAALLGHTPEKIKYLQLAHGRLGSLHDIQLVGNE